LRQHYPSVFEFADDVAIRDDEVLELRSDALLLRRTHSGTARAGGGTYERPYLWLVVFRTDGLMTRMEWFDADRPAEALARFDELTAAPATVRPARRRVRPNAATTSAARVDAAFAARAFESLPTLLDEGSGLNDTTTG